MATTELPEEVVVAFKRSFDEIDANKDGLISAAELQAHLKTLNISTSGAEIAEILSRFNPGGGVAPLNFDSFFKLMSQNMKVCIWRWCVYHFVLSRPPPSLSHSTHNSNSTRQNDKRHFVASRELNPVLVCDLRVHGTHQTKPS